MKELFTVPVSSTCHAQAINYASYDFYKHQLGRVAAAHGGDEKLGRFVAGALAGVCGF